MSRQGGGLSGLSCRALPWVRALLWVWAFLWVGPWLGVPRAVAAPMGGRALVQPSPARSPGESPQEAAPASYLGRTLEDALLTLQARGLRLVFSDRVVRPDMRVTAEPRSTEPRAILDELLRPHGLQVRAGRGNRLVIVPVPAGEGSEGSEPSPGLRVRSTGPRPTPREMPTTPWKIRCGPWSVCRAPPATTSRPKSVCAAAMPTR